MNRKRGIIEIVALDIDVETATREAGRLNKIRE
jgi:hypothetical protein